MYTWYDILLELLLAAAVFAVILILSKKWENQRVCRVVDDRAAPKVEGEPVAQDDTPPFSAEKSEKTADKLSVIVKPMGSEKTLVIEASPSDRVMDLKLKIQEMEGTSVNLQRLIFSGRPLQNDLLLKSCAVVDGSVIHFVRKNNSSLQLTIQTLIGKEYQLECDENDKVEDLKRKIEIVDGCPPDNMRLIYARKQIKDGRFLRDYNIMDGSTVHMVIRLRGGFVVYIRISDGSSLTLYHFDTVTELKQKIHEETGIPIHKQEILFNGTVLKDGCRRVDYNIGSGSTLDVIIRE